MKFFVQDSSSLEHIFAGYEELFDEVSDLDSEIMISRGSAFLWQNLKRLYGNPSSLAVERLVLSLYDCFLEHIQIEKSLVLENFESQALYFPVREQAFKTRELSDPFDVELKSISDLSQSVFQRSKNETRLLQPCRDSLRVFYDRESICRVMSGVHHSLFEAYYIDSISLDKGLAQQVCLQIAEAVKLIESSAPEYAAEISEYVEWYVPLKFDDIDTHHSFTSAQLSGVVFLSLAKNTVRMAEAIVHESGHMLLNMMTDVTPIVLNDDSETYYSPWRQDPRPISGLIHALFVFSRVHLFLSKTNGEKFDSEDIESRKVLILHRLKLGLSQIKQELLTEAGINLVDQISTYVDRKLEDLPVEKRKPSSCIQEHISNWLASNPSLTIVGSGLHGS